MSAILGLLASAIPSVVNGITDALGMQGQSHYQRVNMREAARLQHEENQFWAEYNTPVNQMKRLRDAGLNPNLVYDNGANAQFSGSVSPSGGMPHMRGGYGTDFITFKNMFEQNKNLQAQNDLLKSQAKKTDEETRGVELDNMRKVLTNPYAAKLEWDKHLNNVSERERNQSQTLLNDSYRELNTLEYNAKNEVVHDIYQNLKQKGSLEVELLQLERDYKPSLLASELRINEAKATEILSQVAVARALVDQYEAITDKTKKESLGQDIYNYIQSLQASLLEIENDINSSALKIFIEKYINPIASIIGTAIGIGAKTATTIKAVAPRSKPNPIGF